MIATPTAKIKATRRVTTGDLYILSIGHDPQTGRAIVTGTVGTTPFSAEIPPAALQSFPRFQAAVFAACGCWARCDFVEDQPAAHRVADWNVLVHQAICRGQREGGE